MREWINQSKIDLLAKEIGEENVPILVNIFLGELNDYQSKLVSDTVADKLGYLKEISHALKSSAASFGADRLCAKAVELDSRAKSGEMMDISLEVEHMLQLLKQTHQCYSDLVHELLFDSLSQLLPIMTPVAVGGSQISGNKIPTLF